MSTAMPLPLDIRLMNATSALLLSGLLLAVLAAGFSWLARSPMFRITQITVSGDTQHNTAGSLAAAMGGRLAGNFFTLDLVATQAAFRTAPWVREASVKREFPNRLKVHLEEHVPVARWASEPGHLVDRYGEVFDTGAASESGSALPEFAGPEGQGRMLLETYRVLQDALADMGAGIRRLELEQRGHWRALLDQGAHVELGQGAAPELALRMARFADTAGTVAERYRREVADIESADLRYPSGYALRLRGVSTMAADRRMEGS